MTNRTIGIVVSDGRAKRRSIRDSLSDILRTEESMLPSEFRDFRDAIAKAISIFDQTIEAQNLDHKGNVQQ
ncbi:hypothetical protein SRABI05_00092 [Agrobacterium fabrum]|nr:hypothetical protein SRABI05_00092 [Agrobacterium fabrum]CAH0152403.1 hypothetical protein SRABI46_00807 [Agrobacterium fabrum]